jgi:hypothetical protein
MSQSAEQFRQQAAQHRADAQESFERCDTDGFVSQWASGVNGQVAERNAKIAQAGGVATFVRTRLLTLDGQDTDARLCQTKYGAKWRLDSADKWLAYKPAKASTLAKHGYQEVDEYAVAPAKAQTWAPPGAKGLSGATQVQVIVVRTDELPGGGRERNEWRFYGYGCGATKEA